MKEATRTFKRKLQLTSAQENRLVAWFGACRTVYNLGLEIKIDAYKKCQKSIGKYDLIKQITGLRKDVPWIKDAPICALQFEMQKLDTAYNSFFKKYNSGLPKFKSKKKHKSITFNETINYSISHITIPKIGKVKIFNDSPIEGNLKQIIIKLEATGFYACIVCDSVKPKFISDNQAIGLDMGLTHFCIDSNGDFISNPKHFSKYERRIRIENRSLSRKVKHSKSWYRQSKRLALLHHKIGNVRRDFLHKESTRIAKANNIVYMENLNVSGMAKNHNLSKHILDAGWATFRTMLSYKTNVVAVNPSYTSQTCFECGNIDKGNRKNQSDFNCTNCGHSDNADINAAKNIKSQGMALYRQR